MRKRLFQPAFLLVFAILGSLFHSCDQLDDFPDNGISDSHYRIIADSVSPNPVGIVGVKARVYKFINENDRFQMVGFTSFVDGGFNMPLSPTVAARYLNPVATFFVEEAVISDSNAKMIKLTELAAINGSDSFVGYFNLQAPKRVALWAYADRDVEISGSYERVRNLQKTNYELDLKFKKGWNKIYLFEDTQVVNGVPEKIFIESTEEPSGVVFVWKFYWVN